MSWIICEGTSYLPLRISSFIFLAFFVIGIPFYFLFLFFKHKKSIMNLEINEWLSFFYENYNTKYYWFEFVWFIRKLILTFVIFYLNLSQQNLQIALIIILLSFMVLVSILKPFKFKREENFELYVNLALIVNILLPNNKLYFVLVMIINALFVFSLSIFLLYPVILKKLLPLFRKKPLKEKEMLIKENKIQN